MNFTQRVQAAVSAIHVKTTAVIDATEHQDLLDTIGQMTMDNQTVISERDTAVREKEIALAALEGLAGTAPAEEPAQEAAVDLEAPTTEIPEEGGEDGVGQESESPPE